MECKAADKISLYHFPFFFLTPPSKVTTQMNKDAQKDQNQESKTLHFYDVSNNIYGLIHCRASHYSLTLLVIQSGFSLHTSSSLKVTSIHTQQREM